MLNAERHAVIGGGGPAIFNFTIAGRGSKIAIDV
jgi:hypothetical protein